MGCPKRILIVLALAAAAVCESLAGEPDAAALAVQIDRHIDTRLKTEGIQPAAQADDAEFHRRIYLDLHGTVPSADQTARFLADTTPTKRDKLIETLLASPRYGEHLADIWQGYLVSPLADDQRLRADRLREWLAGRFNSKTWDRIVHELLTATGKMEDNPAVIYLIEGRLPRAVPDLTDLTTRYFLGIRLNCAQCHDHPFVKWSQQDYWGMAAFLTQIQTPGKPKLVYQVGVKDYPDITLATLQKDSMLDGYISRLPTFLGGEQLPQSKVKTNRAALAEWMTSSKNPYFARAAVNRMWWRYFGRGIVRPVDDMHTANAPSHPELLELLSKAFVESGFDLKFISRAILLSRAYQRTSRPGDDAEKQAALFGRMSVKVLSPGQLYDSLVTILGAPARTTGIDARLGPRPEFTHFFADDGDPDPTAYRRGIPHLLRLMNSPQFSGRGLTALSTRLATPGRSVDELAGDLFLTILSRRPTAKELEQFRDHLKSSESAAAASREWAWALLMTSEFSLNH
jgi:Protein of unknown function (DUF1549)/Protein of unknown function (DUF1553)